jgi:malonyl-CoA O-methyltransferase
MLNTFNEAASHYDEAALVQHEIADRLLERLDFIKITPKTILDLGCSTGFCTRKLAERFPEASVTGIDAAEKMIEVAIQNSPATLSYRCEDAHHTNLADHSVDLIFSNLLLEYCDLNRVLSECKRLLKPNGLLLFTTLGPDTLYELRPLLKNKFVDMHHIGDALKNQHFFDPVVDSEHLTVDFSDTKEILYHLKLTGEYESDISEDAMDSNTLSTTYEIIYGHAWQPDYMSQQSVDEEGNVSVPIKILRK